MKDINSGVSTTMRGGPNIEPHETVIDPMELLAVAALRRGWGVVFEPDQTRRCATIALTEDPFGRGPRGSGRTLRMFREMVQGVAGGIAACLAAAEECFAIGAEPAKCPHCQGDPERRPCYLCGDQRGPGYSPRAG